MANRIEIIPTNGDTRAQVRNEKLRRSGFGRKLKDINLVDVYTIDSRIKKSDLNKVASMLTNPVTEKSSINKSLSPKEFDWAIEIGYLPGVTDNIAHTAKEGIEDLLGSKLNENEGVYSSQVTFLSGKLSLEEVTKISESLANPLIQRISIKNYEEFKKNGMDVIVPKVRLNTEQKVDLVDILNASTEELVVIGKQGIENSDGTRRGPLALDLICMKTIQAYFKNLDRNPTDVEVESIAQTWSEHCKHTIFADPMDRIEDGLYNTYIKAATEIIRKQKGDKDFCVSVFTFFSGAIIFDENYLITDKAETHNSPSALDPFGGAITGIVGVNRDAMGFGLGAKPIINRYGFCFADPEYDVQLYKGADFTQKMLSSRMIMDGVIEGVNVGGNCSGIPSPQGFVIFDDNYDGKPLVFVGTLGLIPRVSSGRQSHLKEAQSGDYIVMIGGKVGKDGIHGATFSSEAMDSGSPATAVQIGDPITQKKMSDALIKEARDLGLYTSLTDNGAGGLSCSVAEMAKECGGCYVTLDDVPLKYSGLEPWETWISESQERMTASVPISKWHEFSDLMNRRGVEATIIGEFTDSGKCVVEYNDEIIMDVDMDFLHDGLPKRQMKTSYTKTKHEEPIIPKLGVEKTLEMQTHSLSIMLKSLNISSFEFISQQYDHEVQGGSVIKPLQGRGRINGDATVIRPLLDSDKAVVISQGINPSYSAIDTYHMAACAIDTAIRNAVAVGADLEKVALMDNFCWCSSNEPERLGQLKAAVKACYNYSIAFGTPFISGKDSMFNDFKGYDSFGDPIKISVPPTLLVSSVSVMEDSTKAVSLDAKIGGDVVYVIGDTYDELGASEYFVFFGEQERGVKYIGNDVPKVNVNKNKKSYVALSNAINKGLIASSQSVHKGGLAVALAKTSMGGKLGMDIHLENICGTTSRDEFTLYSESQGRILVTVAPEYQKSFEEVMFGNSIHMIGKVTEDKQFVVKGRDGNEIINTNVNSLLRSYKSSFEGF